MQCLRSAKRKKTGVLIFSSLCVLDLAVLPGARVWAEVPEYAQTQGYSCRADADHPSRSQRA